MKSIFAGCLTVLALSSTAFAQSPMDGIWEVEFKCRIAAQYPNCPEAGSFILGLVSTGSKICGLHEAVAHGGGKIDSTEDFPSIFGTVHDGEAQVEFHGSFGGSGHALIRVVKNTLVWSITDANTKNGEYWLPKRAKLVKAGREIHVDLPTNCILPDKQP